jgi:hypothetical protein
MPDDLSRYRSVHAGDETRIYDGAQLVAVFKGDAALKLARDALASYSEGKR